MTLRTQRAFTLVEVLVVLVITSLITTILLQALSQMWLVQRRLNASIQDTSSAALRDHWYKMLMQGLYPAPARAEGVFKGESRRLQGITLFPLDATPGAPVKFSLSIERQRGDDLVALRYVSTGQPVVLMSWRGDAGRFLYEDAQGTRHEQWPPALGIWPQLPNAVLLQTAEEGQPRLLPGVPAGPANPPKRFDDLFKTDA